MSVSDPRLFPANAMTIETHDKSGFKPAEPSAGDQNDNVIQLGSESIAAKDSEKEYDFLVWHDTCNEKEADTIYKEMEDRGLKGYMYERDKKAGQYKLPAMEAAAKNTATVILLISRPALQGVEFTRNMHSTVTSPQNDVIPIYIGIRKSAGPRLLKHHVDIQYKDTEFFWDRLYHSMLRQTKGEDALPESQLLSKPEKKPPLDAPSAHSSPTSKQSVVKPPKMVPEARHRSSPPRHSSPSSSPSSSSQKSERGGLLGWFRTRNNAPTEMPAIPMKPIRTKSKTCANDK